MSYIAPTTRAAGYTVTAAADFNPIVNDIISLRPDTCLVGRTALYTLAYNSDTAFPWDYERLDAGAMHNPADNTKITILRYGIYRVTVNLEFGSHAGGYDEIVIKLNGSVPISRSAKPGDASHTNAFSLTADWSCTIGALSYVEVFVKQTRSSTGTLDLTYDGNYYPMFSVSLVQDLT